MSLRLLVCLSCAVRYHQDDNVLIEMYRINYLMLSQRARRNFVASRYDASRLRRKPPAVNMLIHPLLCTRYLSFHRGLPLSTSAPSMKCYSYFEATGPMSHVCRCFPCNAPEMPHSVKGSLPNELSGLVPLAMPANYPILGGLCPRHDRHPTQSIEVSARTCFAICDSRPGLTNRIDKKLSIYSTMAMITI